MDHFLGERNTATSKLENLAKNYETFGIWKKLACMMGEGNHRVLEDTDVLKRLTGGDKMDFEKKYADKFTDYSYCKLIMATNSLPSSEDTSEGYFRRWIIVDFPNEFPEGKPVWKKIPDKEYNALAKKILRILPELLERGSFTNQGTVKERKERYIAKSNPLSIFIKEQCVLTDLNQSVLYGRLYNEYVKWLLAKKLRKVTHKEFNTMLENEGFEKVKTSKNINGEWINGNFIQGIKIKNEFEGYRPYVTDVTDVTGVQTNTIRVNSSFKPSHNEHNGHTGSEKAEFDFGFPQETDLLEAVKHTKNLMHIDDLRNLFPVPDFDEKIRFLKQKGSLYEPKKGFLAVLE